MLRADTSTLPIADEHNATEEPLRGSGIPYILLRKRLVDRTAAAVSVLTTQWTGRQRQTYGLAGDYAFTMKELAEAVSDWAGRVAPYHDLPASEYQPMLAKAGVPEIFVEISVRRMSRSRAVTWTAAAATFTR